MSQGLFAILLHLTQVTATMPPKGGTIFVHVCKYTCRVYSRQERNPANLPLLISVLEFC